MHTRMNWEWKLELLFGSEENIEDLRTHHKEKLLMYNNLVGLLGERLPSIMVKVGYTHVHYFCWAQKGTRHTFAKLPSNFGLHPIFWITYNRLIDMIIGYSGGPQLDQSPLMIIQLFWCNCFFSPVEFNCLWHLHNGGEK